jgi:ADP-ribosylglycohydrolase
MALCLADSLIACGGTDTRDQAERYLHWLRDGRRSATGVAAGVRPELRRTLALAAARRSALSGSHDPNLLDSEPLARAAPPAIYFIDDLAAATDAAADAARVSHQAPVLVDACRLFCAMLHAALNGVDRPGLLGLHRDWQDLLRPEVMAVAQGWSGGGRRGRVRGAILQTLDAAVRAFAGAQDFRHGLGTLLAGHLADPDVASAAYGQLAGAFFGERGIPSSLREGLVDAAVIAGIADALLPSGALAESSPQGLLSR